MIFSKHMYYAKRYLLAHLIHQLMYEDWSVIDVYQTVQVLKQVSFENSYTHVALKGNTVNIFFSYV